MNAVAPEQLSGAKEGMPTLMFVAALAEAKLYSGGKVTLEKIQGAWEKVGGTTGAKLPGMCVYSMRSVTARAATKQRRCVCREGKVHFTSCTWGTARFRG